eukprot:TRINITY_DN9650_c0_g1_i1.p1 TRINITY_DN9650_c0_g1~~TRINITY_DN9650_c0_g1_i1.p1  ORF type:complete len:480 (-),score=51.42 TRINITY_DN9650_c0_g1_i1:415-1854(-)
MNAGSCSLSSRDEAVRDLKKQLSSASSPQREAMFIRQVSDPQPIRSVETASQIAQPGGFRRHHLVNQGRLSENHPSLFRQLRMLPAQMLTPSFAFPMLIDDDDDATSVFAGVRTSGNSSGMVSALVLVKSFLTGSLLVVPKGFSSAGLSGGCLVLLAVGICEVYCMLLLVRSRRAVGPSTYADLAGCLGRFGKPMLSAMLVISQYGFVCAEQIYVADNALKSFQLAIPWVEEKHLLFFFQLVLIPLSLIRKLKFFAITNLLGDGLIIFSVLYLFAFGFVEISEQGPSPEVVQFGEPKGAVLFFATCIYVYEGINMILPIYEAHQNKDTFDSILVTVLITLTVVFITFGCLWYSVFGDSVADIASLNLAPESVGSKVISPLYAFACLLTTPVLFFPVAQELETRLFPLELWRSPFSRKWAKNVFRAILMFLSAVVAAVGGKSMQNFLALIGGLCCGPLAIILPAAIHWLSISCHVAFVML